MPCTIAARNEEERNLLGPSPSSTEQKLAPETKQGVDDVFADAASDATSASPPPFSVNPPSRREW